MRAFNGVGLLQKVPSFPGLHIVFPARNEELKPGHVWIYTRTIKTRSGKRIVKKDGGVYKFQVPASQVQPKVEKKPKDDEAS